MRFTTKDIKLAFLFIVIASIIGASTFIYSMIYNLPYEKVIHGYSIASLFLGFGLGYFIEIKK